MCTAMQWHDCLLLCILFMFCALWCSSNRYSITRISWHRKTSKLTTKRYPDIYRSFGSTEVRIVEDYGSGVRYVVDLWRYKCMAQSLGVTLFTKNSTGKNNSAFQLSMRKGSEIFDLDQGGWQFTGVVAVRGLPSDRFLRKDKKTKMTTEVYFLRGTASSHTPVAVRWWNESSGQEYFAHLLHYSSHVVGTSDLFDVRVCYGWGARAGSELAAYVPVSLNRVKCSLFYWQ